MAQPTAPQRGARDKEQRRLALMDAANAVFAEHGFDCATTRAIAERAGCAEGLIHRYFSGKRGLLLAILASKAAHVGDDLQAALPDRETVREEIEQLLDWCLRTYWERRDFMRVSVSQAAIDPEIGRSVGSGINARQAALIRDKLQRHRAACRIRPDADLEATAHSLTGLGFAIGFLFQVCFGADRSLARRLLAEGAQTTTPRLTP